MKNKVILVGNVLTVVTESGNVYSSTQGSMELYNELLAALDEERVKELMVPELYKKEVAVKQEAERVGRIVSSFKMLTDTGLFEFRDDSVYMAGINRSMPEMLINKFAEVVGRVYNDDTDTSLEGVSFTATDWVEHVKLDEEYKALKNFWYWSCLNPRAEVTDKLYGFLVKNGMQITKEGLFVALRNVVRREATNNEYVQFISEEYNKIKLRKKGPGNFEIFQKLEDSTYHLFQVGAPYPEGTEKADWEFKGNLKELYLELPDLQQNDYTDAYTRSFDIKIGQKVAMAPEQCSWSTADCAEKGLHFAGHTAPYVLCGDTTVFTLINPMKVVGIGAEKGRCYEYLPFMVTTVDQADNIMNSGEFDFLELDEQYAKDELSGLEERVKEGFAIEAKKYSFNIPSIDSTQVHRIVDALNGIDEEVKNRVQDVESGFEEVDDSPEDYEDDYRESWDDDNEDY